MAPRFAAVALALPLGRATAAGFDGFEPGPFRIVSVHRPRDVGTDGERTFSVWRQDEHGNAFEVSRGHSEAEARRRAEELQARHHKQVYWVERERRAG